jgi:hypothetical protein
VEPELFTGPNAGATLEAPMETPMKIDAINASRFTI